MAIVASVSGINNISGPGMLDFESCQSLEKLVLDNEICAMARRLRAGIEPREDFPAAPLFQELFREGHLLIAAHTRRHLRHEHLFPGPVVDRAQRSRWLEEGSRPLGERARAEVARHLAAWEPVRLPAEAQAALTERMSAEARRFGMDRLPDHAG